jgi:acetyl esterase/lipase
LTKIEAVNITVQNVLGGADSWNPSSPLGANKLNIEYGEAGGEKLLLDAHVPDGDGKFPVAILVHGGGWNNGDKEQDIVPVFAPVATNFTWFTINYRLAPENRWPACFDDVQTAIRWVKKHAQEFKGDPDRIALIGYSAGGLLTLLSGTLDEKDTQVQAVVGLAPPADVFGDATQRGLDKWPAMKDLLGAGSLDEKTLKLMKEISPVDHVKPGLPPFLLIQGNADKSVSYNFTVDFATKLRAANVPYEFITITNAGHRILDWQQFDPDFQQKWIAWLAKKLAANTPAETSLAK